MAPMLPAPAGAPPLGQEMETPEDTTDDSADGSYTIELQCHADGSFTVDDKPEVYDTFEAALKAVMKTWRAHPIGATASQDMAAGYGPTDAHR